MKNRDQPPNEYSQEEHDRLCTGAVYSPWTFERKACEHEAIKTIGGGYIGVYPLRFCRYHWHDFELQVTEEIRTGGILEFVQDFVLRSATWQVVEDERRRVRAMREAEEDSRRALRVEREAQRQLDRDAAALTSDLAAGARVYFVQAGKRGPIKIGMANDVLKRLDVLQTGNPHRLRIRATVPGGRAEEGQYHRIFAEHRLSGEWFKPVAVIRAEIDRINAIKRRGDGALF